MINEEYTAFISYRHASPDEEIARRLITLIENYKVPRDVKKGSGIRSMGRVFRDRDELPLSADLGADIRTALDRSEWLIVVCSPRYLESRWCMEELNHFLASGRRDRILTVLVDGEPNQSFPPQLCYLNDGGRTVALEPLAADVRAPSVRGALKRLKEEKLRLLAPMLGVSFDRLRKRARKRRTRIAAGAACAVVTVLSVFLAYALVKNAQVTAQRDLAVNNQMMLLIEQSNVSSDAGNKRLARKQLCEAAALRSEVGDANDEELRSALEYALYNDSFGKVLTIDNDNRNFTSLVFSGGGDYLLGITNLNSACLIDATTGRLLYTVSRSDVGQLDSVGFTCDDKYFYTVDSWYGFVSLYDVQTGELYEQYDASDGNAWNIGEKVFPMEDGKMLIVRRDTLVIWDYVHGKTKETLPCGDGTFESYTQPLIVELSPDGKRAAIGSHGYGTGMHIVKLDGTDEVQLDFDRERGYPTIVFSGNGKFLAGLSVSRFYVWDAFSGEQIFEGDLGEESAGADSILLSHDGKLLVVAGSDCLCVYDVLGGQELWSIREETNIVTEVHISSDGKYVSAYGEIHGIYDALTGELLCDENAGAFCGPLVIVGSYNSDPSLLVTPTGEAPYYTDDTPAASALWGVPRYTEPDGNVRLNLQHNCAEIYSTPPGNANRKAYAYVSPDVKYAAYTHYDGFIEVFDISRTDGPKELYCVAEHCFSSVSDLTFHGDLMASCGGFDPRCVLFDLADGKILHVLCAEEYAWGCEFSPDGTKIIVLCGGTRGAAIVFSAQTGNRLFTLRAPDGRSFDTVGFTDDGMLAAALLEGGGAVVGKLYPTLDDMIAAAAVR